MNEPPFGIVAASVPDGLAVQLEFETKEQRDVFKRQKFDLWICDEYGEPTCYFNDESVEHFISKVHKRKERGGPKISPYSTWISITPFWLMTF